MEPTTNSTGPSMGPTPRYGKGATVVMLFSIRASCF